MYNIKNATKINLNGGDNIVHLDREDGGKDIAYRFNDSVLKDGYYDIIIKDYDDFLEDENYYTELPRQVLKSYVIKNSMFNKEEELAIEFLLHFMMQISSIDLDLLSIDMPFENEVYSKIQSAENKHLKDAYLVSIVIY